MRLLSILGSVIVLSVATLISRHLRTVSAPCSRHSLQVHLWLRCHSKHWTYGTPPSEEERFIPFLKPYVNFGQSTSNSPSSISATEGAAKRQTATRQEAVLRTTLQLPQTPQRVKAHLTMTSCCMMNPIMNSLGTSVKMSSYSKMNLAEW